MKNSIINYALFFGLFFIPIFANVQTPKQTLHNDTNFMAQIAGEPDKKAAIL